MATSIEIPDIDFGTAPLEDFYRHIHRWQEAGRRVVPVNYNGETGWIILRYEDVQAVYRNEAQIPAAAAYRRHSEPVQGRTLLAMEGEAHRINRLLVSRAFHPQAIQKLVPELLIPLANELIDSLPDTGEIDLVAEFCYRYPFKVISRMLGIPVTDEQQMHGWLEGLFLYPWDPEAALKARDNITAYLEPLVEARRQQPGDDLISSLTQAEAEGHRLDNEEIFSFIRLLYPAGSDTTYLALGSLLFEVLANPGICDQLIAHPELREQAVEESLRLHGTVCLQPRYTENDVTIAGVEIPAHSILLFGNGPANHDPTIYPQPDQFSLERCPRKIMTFGGGPHFCLGSHLARAEMRVSLALLLDRLIGLQLPNPRDVHMTSAVLRGPRAMTVSYQHRAPAPLVEETVQRL